MKKILSISALLLITISLVACSLTNSEKPEATNFTGLLVEQSSTDDYAGSHLLIDDAGQIITPIRSLTINLSNSEYLNNKVQILGTLNTADNVFEVTGLSVLEVVSKDAAKHELTEYKNLDLGFRLKYYSDWKAVEGGNMVTFEAPSEAGNTDIDKVVIIQSPFLYEAPVETPDTATSDVVEPTTGLVQPPDVTKEALKAYMTENNYLGYEWQIIGPDRMNATKDDQTYNTDYFLYRTGYVYAFRFSPATVAPIAENKAVFNQMLAEFQFLPFGNGSSLDNASVDTTSSGISIPANDDMTSFESSIYHFSAQYPEDWYYSGTKGTTAEVLHHYAFSNTATTENELIGMDIMKDGKPEGQQDSSTYGDTYTIYTNVDGGTYRISGKKEYKAFIDAMAKSITPIQNSEIQ
jgi:hypothetical protein